MLLMLEKEKFFANLIKFFLFLSFFMVSLSPAIIFLNNYFVFKLIYFLVLAFPIFVLYKKINTTYLFILFSIYILIFLLSEKNNVLAFIIPAYIILIIYDEDFFKSFLNITIIYLIFSILMMLFQKNGLLIFDFLNIETSAEKKIILRRPPTIFPFQIYFNQLIVFFILTAILFINEYKSSIILILTAVISALSGSMLLITTQLITVLYLYSSSKIKFANNQILILNLVLLFSYYFYKNDHSYNYNVINLIFSFFARIYSIDTPSLLNIDIILFVLPTLFISFFLLNILKKKLNIKNKNLVKLFYVVLMILISQSANLNYDSLFFSIFIGQISYILIKLKFEI